MIFLYAVMGSKTLAAVDPSRGRSALFRMVEWSLLLVFGALALWLAARTWRVLLDHPLVSLLGALCAVLVMDMISGTLHWAADTWGSARWPLIGPTVLRTFREHHVDPDAITRHDFIEVNATSTFFALPFLAVGHLWGTESALVSGFVLLGVCPFGLLTNQIHAWSHRKENPAWVRLLQRSGVILSVEDHARHHVAPYTEYYCITTGWLNPLLSRTRFWRHCERVISAITGAKPRAEDSIAKDVLAPEPTSDSPELGATLPRTADNPRLAQEPRPTPRRGACSGRARAPCPAPPSSARRARRRGPPSAPSGGRASGSPGARPPAPAPPPRSRRRVFP